MIDTRPSFQPSGAAWAVIVMVLAAAGACSEDEPPAERLEVSPVEGPASFPELETGAPADLSLLGPDERAVIEEADARATQLRTRPLELRVPDGAEVRLELVRHGFPFGVAMELRKLDSEEDLEWYSRTASKTFNFAVLESEAKWKVTGPEPGVRDYAAPDAVLQWADRWDMDVKGHVLVWGNAPPLSSSGIPAWVLERFPESDLTEAERAELRGLLEEHVRDSVRRYAGRIRWWDITNETLQPLAQWFIDRLGPEITRDAFRWAQEEDPEATLVMNEWIREIFTGIGGPTATHIRDRLLELREAGVPVDAVGIQGQFTPAAAHLGPGANVSNRTPLDEYAEALDTLGEAGVPIHITEINVFTPEDQTVRAAHLEGAMRIWWGHPAVEQIGFWSLWNGVSGKAAYDVGLYDDAKEITPMGEAVMHLLNDAWRTRVTTIATGGRVAVDAAAGEYLVEYSVGGHTRHATFEVPMGEARLIVDLRSE